MAKPIKILLEISGYQTARIDDDGAMLRPVTAAEIVKAIADDLEHKARNGGMGKFKVTVKPLN